MESYKKKARDMFELYEEKGLTLFSIGKIYGVSREGVRQILKKHTEYQGKWNRNSPLRRVKISCLFCKKEFEVRPSQNRTFCSMACLKKNRFNKPIWKERGVSSLEEYWAYMRKYHRKNSSNYYYSHRSDHAWYKKMLRLNLERRRRNMHKIKSE
jgi:Sigma-70, region 4